MKNILRYSAAVLPVLLLFAVSAAGQDTNEEEKTKACSVFLEVEFLAAGRVGEVSLLSSTCAENSGLAEKAVEAARGISFRPKTVGGRPVTETRTVRYDIRIEVENGPEQITNIEYEDSAEAPAKALAVIEKAVGKLGGERYRQVRNSVGEGRLSLIKGGRIISFQSFTDIIVYPLKERTDFTERGAKTVMVNTGDRKGWFYDEMLEKFDDQTDRQTENFMRSFRSHYNYLLRGAWKGEAELTYVGRREAGLGERNDVLKLSFEDGFEVEYEFSDEGLPMKTVYTVMNSENLPVTEETRFARYVEQQGIQVPFVVDRYTNEELSFRVNYESMEFNKIIPEDIFTKPEDTKKLRKKLKL